jgi:PAS domain S-box-containing protein
MINSQNSNTLPVSPQSDNSLRIFCENSPDPVVILDPGHRIKYVNKAFVSLTGFSFDELADCLPPYPYQSETIKEDRKDSSPEGEIRKQEQVWKKKNGQVVWVEVSVVPINEGGDLKQIICLAKNLTGRKELETGLRTAEEKFSRLLNAIPIPISVAALPSGIIEDVNESFLKTSGFTRGEIVGHSGDFIKWKDTAARDEAVKVLLEKGHFNDLEMRVESKSGEPRTSSLSAEIVKIGGKSYMVSASLDITDHKKAEEALIESEAFKTSLLTEAPNPILVLNNDGSIKYANPALERLTGFSSDEIRGFPPFPWWPPELVNEFFSGFKETKTSETGLFERRYRRKNGETFWCIVNVRHTREEGSHKYHIINWVDITASKNIEIALRESEAFNSKLLQDAPNPILLSDNDGRIHFVNPAFEKLTGFSSDELKNVTPPFPWWPREKIEQYLNEKNYSTPVENSFRERLFQKKNGDLFWAGITLQSISEQGHKQFLLANWVDITERKHMEKRIVDLYLKEKQQREEIEEETKARGLFINVLAHELRTPITPILLSIGMLKDRVDQQPDRLQKKLTDNIFQSTHLLARRLEELLDLGRYSQGSFKLQKKLVDTPEFIKNIVSRCQQTLEMKNQRLILNSPDDLPSIEADTARLEQVFFNLLSNASNFSPKGAVLELTLKTREDRLEVDVKDRGAGISPEDQKKLFKPYHRVEQDRQQFPGLGLGLAVTRQIVEAHDGKIWVQSEPGQGSTFSFFIPLQTGINCGQEVLED